MSKRTFVEEVVEAARGYSGEVILFHQVVGELLRVNPADMRCLDFVMTKGSATPTEISNHVGLSTGATTAMIDRLEKGKFVERRPHPKDRRGTLVLLSDEGNRKLGTMFSAVGKVMERLVSRFSHDELEILNRFFREASLHWKGERERLLTTA